MAQNFEDVQKFGKENLDSAVKAMTALTKGYQAIAAEMDSGPNDATWLSGRPEIDAMLPAAYFNPRGFSGFGTVNTPDWREASTRSRTYSMIDGETRTAAA